MAWPVLPHGLLGASGTPDIDPYQVQRSLRFDGAASLNRTFGTPTSQGVFTLSMWVKLGGLGTVRDLFTATGGTANSFGFTSGNVLNLTFAGTTTVLNTTGVFRDPAAWYHIVWSSNAASQIVYVNGASVGTASTATAVFNTAAVHRIGSNAAGGGNFFTGYMAEVIFVDGQALLPSAFAETASETNRWRPKAYAGTYGNNGFRLSFEDNSGVTSATLGKDRNASNDWTPNGFSVTAGAGNDSLVESPTNFGTDTGFGGEVRGNYCVWNPLVAGAVAPVNGNLDIGASTIARGTHQLLQADNYWEITSTGGTTTAGIITEAGSATTTTIATGKTYGFRVTTAGVATWRNVTDNGLPTSLATGLTGTVFPYASTPAATTASLNSGQRPFAAPAIPPTGSPELLLPFNTSVADTSGNSRALTVSGVTINTTTRRYGAGAAQFQKSSNRFIDSNYAVPSDLFSGSTWTIETWINAPNVDSQCIINSHPHNHFALGFNYGSSGQVSMIFGDGLNWTSSLFFSSVFLSYNTWHHIAVVRNGSVVTLYVNGVSSATSSTMPTGTCTGYRIGAITFSGGFSGESFDGLMDDFRITRQALYTTNFTPPSQELFVGQGSARSLVSRNIPDNASRISRSDDHLDVVSYSGDGTTRNLPESRFQIGLSWVKNRTTASTSHVLIDQARKPSLSTSLLLNMNGANGGTVFPDSSAYSNPIIVAGNAQTSTAQSKFGGSSGLFDGNGDFLEVADRDSLELGGQDFTIECWVRFSNVSKGYQAIASKNHAAADANGWVLTLEQDNTLNFYAGSGGWVVLIGSGIVPLVNTWHHLAVTRSGNNWLMFRDGTLIGSFFGDFTFPNGSLPLYVGRYPYFPFGNATDFQGNMQDFSITKGVAKYTANFTAPASQLLGYNSLSTDSSGAEIGTSCSIASGGISLSVTGTSSLNAASNTYINFRWGTQPPITSSLTSNTSGTIASSVSANPTAGFSVLTYTGTGSNATVGHGLNATPAMIWVKQRNSGTNAGAVYHSSLGATAYLRLFETTTGNSASTTDNTVWNGGAPTFNTSVFSIGTSARTNTNTGLYVAYCFAQIPGYSRFGTYAANALADGPFVWCGFRPRLILIKPNAASSSWSIIDTARDTVNLSTRGIFPDTAGAETTDRAVDILSNGFKIRSATVLNATGVTHVFAAFAEAPFKYARAR